MRHLLPILAGSLLFGCAARQPSTVDSHFESLFNGRDLSSWAIENGGKFSVRDGVIAVDKGTGWLRSKRELGNFVFALEFRFLEPEANSGIFVRTGPTSHDNDEGWPDNGYQVQCKDDLDGEAPLATMIHYGGAGLVKGDYDSDVAKIRKAYHGVGHWNHYEIRCVGENLTVHLNGELVTTARNVKNARGHLGIQAEHGLLEFRNLRVKELSPGAAGR
jgi:hypothetical protein